MTLEEAIMGDVVATRQFAKRQMTVCAARAGRLVRSVAEDAAWKTKNG